MIYDISKSLRDLIASLPRNPKIEDEILKDFTKENPSSNEFLLNMKESYYKFASTKILKMKNKHSFIMPLELKYRLNYFGFYSDEMTK